MSINSIFFFGLLLVTPAIGLGTMIEVPSKAIDFECSVSPAPEYGQYFTVSASFSLKDETYYMDHEGAGGRATLITFPKQEFIAGDTTLLGRFEKGITYTLSATYRAVNPGRFHVAMKLKTYDEAEANGRAKAGGYTHTSCDCGYYIVQEGTPTPRSVILDSATGLRITMLADSLPPGVPKPAVPYPVELNDTNRRGKRQADEKARIDKMKIEGEKAPRRLPPHVVHLRKLKDGLYEQTGTIKLPKRRQCELIFREVNSDIILRPQFPDSIRQSWWMHPAGDTGVFLTPQDTGKIYLEGQLDGKVLILRMEVSDAWILDGIWRYTDPFGNLDNRLSLTTLFFYLKDYQGEWQYWISDYADANGYFATMIFDADVLVQAVTENIQCFVFRTDGELGPGSEQAYYHGFAVSVEGNVNFQDITIPAQYTTIGQQYWYIGGAFNICNVIRNGYLNFGYDLPYQVPVYHDNSDPTILSSSYGGVSLNGVRGIIIQGSAPPGNNWDQWDSSIVLHEYGHAFMDQNAQLPPITQNQHYYYMPTSAAVH